MPVSGKWWWGPAAVLAVLGPGCAHHAQSEPDETQKVQEFRLAKEDVVEVSVWKEPELSRTVPVRPDGKIRRQLAAGDTVVVP